MFGGTQQQRAGLFGQTQQPQQQAGNLFGGNTQTASAGLFGNTSTNANSAFLGQQQPQQQSLFGTNPSPFGATQVLPVGSMNTKLKINCRVKCIAALYQFNGLSKEEIRISFIQSVGEQPDAFATFTFRKKAFPKKSSFKDWMT